MNKEQFPAPSAPTVQAIPEAAPKSKKPWTKPVIEVVEMKTAKSGSRTGPPDGFSSHSRS